MLSTAFRWLTADGVGAVGKTEQLTRGIHRGGAGALPCQLPRAVAERVTDLRLEHAGSVAQIFRACVPDGGAVALKVVPAAVGEAVLAETRAADQAGTLAAWAFGTRAVDAVRELNRGLRQELCMRHERRMARLLREALQEHPHCSVPPERPALCSDEVYCYEYVEGPTAARAITGTVVDGRHLLADRLAHLFFELLHVHGLLLLDPNLTNAIAGDGILWLIDTGAVAVMNAHQRALLAELHATRGDRDALARLLGSPPGPTALIADCMAAFWDERRSFPDGAQVLGLLTDPSMLSVDFDPAITPLFRATVTLVTSLQRAGITGVRVAAHMERLVVAPAAQQGNQLGSDDACVAIIARQRGVDDSPTRQAVASGAA